jgi:photosystem II stability/assembly factor-like uncharacterized protein
MIRTFRSVALSALILAGAFDFGSAQEPRSPLLKSFESYLFLKRSSTFNLKWVPIGPVMNSARAASVQIDPARPATMYVAFGPGNLWKTVNRGLTWTPIFENQSALGIGHIALAPSDPNVLWLGSGVNLKKPRNFTMPGTGVFRSDDGGATWRNTGLPDSYHIGKIAVHPKDPNTVIAAVQGHFWTTNENRGLYRTTDGGSTWSRVLYVNDRTGGNDVVFAPSDPRIVYASLWEDYPDIFGPESGVYKSTDGGATWTRLRGGLPDGPKTGRIGLAVSWQNPDKAYALVDNLNKDRNLAAELYRTMDGGRTWTRTHADELLIYPAIGWYFGCCQVNPRNDDEVWACGVRIAHSADGGKIFDLIGGDVFHVVPNPADPLHLDHCEIWVNPLNPDHLVVGNDGGLYVSEDKGRTWTHFNNLPVGEFYDIAVDEQDPYNVYAGSQDDATVYGPAREWNPKFPDGWKYIWLDAWSGGDGCVTAIDPVDPNTVYFSSQNGAIRRKDMRADRSVGIMPRPSKDSGIKTAYNFIAPYILSPHDRFTLYHAGNVVFKSVNRGDAWTLISPDLARSVDPAKLSTAAGAIAESRLTPGLLYVGTDKGALWVTKNDGRDWVERSAGLPDRYIRSICPSRFVLSRVYLTLSGLNDDDFGVHVFASEDLGASWTPIAGNLPDEVAYGILEDPTNAEILYAGLYRGVYISVDRGRSWSHLGPEMPGAAVSRLVIQEREMDLLAGTYGRGIYKMNLRPVQAAFKSAPPRGDRLFDPPPARLPWINDTHRDPRLSTVEKVPLTFFLKRDAAVTLAVRDRAGKTVWSTPIAGRAGFNQVFWDLVTARADSPRPYFTAYLTFAPAGTYEVSVSGEGIDLKAPLTIVPRTSPER